MDDDLRPLRKVVGRNNRPYDTTFDGTVLTVPMDVLECGHEVRVMNDHRGMRITREPGQSAEFIAANRRCPKCKPEEGP